MSEQQPERSSSTKGKRGRGRPRKQPLTEVTNLQVTVEGKDAALQTTRDDLKRTDVLFSLAVPNRLLVEWWKNASHPRDYIPALNAQIVDQAVAVRSDCDRIATNLATRAGKLTSQVAAASGRARESILACHSHIPVCQGNTVAPLPLLDELTDLHIEMANVTVAMAQREEEVKTLKTRINQILLEKASMINQGKMVEDVSVRQRSRKLSSFRSSAEAALWFAETFGLVVDKVVTHTLHSEEEVVVNLSQGHSAESAFTPPVQPPSSAPDEFCAMQILYLLDRFGVSDEFYHELTQVCPSLPRSYRVKHTRTHLNNEVDVISLPDADGAYRPLKPALAAVLEHELACHPKTDRDKAIHVKLSGDGARFSSSSTFLLLSFSLPGTATNVLSGGGNHTFAAFRGKENYSNLSSLMVVLDEINDLLDNPHLHIGGKTVSLEVLLGGDFKFLLMIMGFNEAHSNYACIWCTIPADERWDMSVDEDVYCRQKARTLTSIKEKSKLGKKPCSQHLGSVRPPLVNVEPSHIVLDELHLLLRIGDVLIRNLIWYAASRDLRNRERQGVRGATCTSHVIQLEQAIRSCRVSFQIWLKKDHNGRPVPGSYDWTALTGKHKYQVLQTLPELMPSFLPEDLCPSVVRLWTDFCKLYKVMSSWTPSPTEIDAFHEQAKQWVRSFVALGGQLQGHQKKYVTPYMHSMVYHVPRMLRLYGNIKKFSGQGVEKNNDDSKRHYYSSNKHDAPVELIRSEVRLEVLARGKDGYPSCQRMKRPYNKACDEYWHGGGIQEDRRIKRQRHNQ